MKVNRIIVPLILILFLFFLLKSYRLKSLEETLQACVASYGFTSTVEKAWIKLNGRVYLQNVTLTDTLGTTITVEKVVLHSSLLGLSSLQKHAVKGTLTSDIVAKKVKKAQITNVQGGYQKYSGGIFSIALVKLFSKKKTLHFEMVLPHLEHGKIKLSKGKVTGLLSGDYVEVHDAEFNSFQGNISANAKVHRFKDVHNLSLAYSDLQISELIHSQKMQGSCFGSFYLDTFALKELEEPHRLYGTGSVEVHNFSQKGEKRFNTALHKLKRLGIKKLDFATIKGDLELKNGRVISENLTFTNKDYRLVANGRYRIKRNSFNFKIDGFLKPHMRSKMKSIVWGALIYTDTNERKFTGAARGVPDKYVVTVDGKIIKRGINSFFNTIFK